MLRVRGDRMRARINERSQYSQTPTLVGRLVPAADGTRVVGSIRWTQQLFMLVLLPVGALLCAGAGLDLLGNGDLWGALLFGVFTLFFAALAGAHVATFRREREHETERIAQEIRRTFAKRP